MTTLVTGGTGRLGSAVLECLLERGHRGIRCLIRPGNGRAHMQSLRDKYGSDAFEIVHGNLTQRADVARALEGVDRVIHLAASMRGAPADMFLNTVVGSKILFDGVNRSRVRRLVVVSSLAVYELHDVAPSKMIDESAAIERQPERRDVYTHTKVLQEGLLLRTPMRECLTSVVLRPGPLYGNTTPVLPARLGLQLAGCLLQLGAGGALPLANFANCADAVCFAAFDDRFRQGAYNVVDDDLPTANAFISRYRAEVNRIPTLRLPLLATLLLARLNEHSHKRWGPQIPQVLTSYRVRNLWRGHQYSNARLKAAGWCQPIATGEALDAAFKAWRTA